MKKIISILLTIILASFMTVSVFADYDYKYYESIREIPRHKRAIARVLIFTTALVTISLMP